MTSLRQKLVLIVLGIFLSVVLLEIGLRAAGVLVLFLQERHNHVSYSPNEYRILCLGESTTALGGEDSYPSRLEAILNARPGSKKYTVINKGVISTTSNYILAHLDQNLDMYKPQLVVVMMGINDRAYLHDFNKTLWWENFKSCVRDLKVYKLVHLVYEHVTHRVKGINAPAQAVDLSDQEGNDQRVEDFLKIVVVQSLKKYHDDPSDRKDLVQAGLACVELARRYRLQGNFQQAENILKQAVVLIPDQAFVYEEWGELDLARKQSAQALRAFQVSLSLDPKNSNVFLGLAHAYHQEHRDGAYLFYAGYLQTKPQDYWGYIELARWLKEGKHYAQAAAYLDHAIQVTPYFEQAYVDLGQILDDQGQYKQEESFYLKEISLHPKSLRLYEALGRFYQAHGKNDLAREYFQKAADFQMPEYCPATLVNYRVLLDKVLSRHIKVIVMQYPMREIGVLKNYLGQRKDIIFVENKENFVQALPDGGYWHYFKDNFAYDFGHCTRAGNDLIAQNLKEIILKNLLL